MTGHQYETADGPLIEIPIAPYVTDGVVWHHTNAQALISIIENKCLWASSFRSMNDSSEITYGVEVLEEAITIYKSIGRDTTQPSAPPLQPVLMQILEELLKMDIQSTAREKSFLISATTERDSLNQWQGYSGRQGYALGFEVSAGLKGSPEQTDLSGPMDILGSPSWMQVVYDREEQLKLVHSIIRNASRQAESMLTEGPEEVSLEQRYQNYVSLVTMPLIHCAASFKHHAFSSEREVRWFAQGRSEVHFRASNRGIVPFIKQYFCIGKGDTPENATRLAYIMCGPGLDQDQDEDIMNVKQLLTAHGISADDVVVEKSEVPYRF